MRLYGYPEIFKEILAHFPTVAMKTISIKEFFYEGRKVSQNYLAGHIPEKLLKRLKKILPKPVQLTKKIQHSHAISGELLLRVFFSQLLNPEGVILDLRKIHFSKKNEFAPVPLWYQFKPKFRKGLISLYSGFYHEDQKLFYQSLGELGLTKGLKQKEIEKLAQLFYEQFQVGTDHVVFKLSDFNASFLNVFKFFTKHKMRIPIDFLFLGVYLTGLYQHLEEHGEQGFNVAQVFMDIFPRK